MSSLPRVAHPQALSSCQQDLPQRSTKLGLWMNTKSALGMKGTSLLQSFRDCTVLSRTTSLQLRLVEAHYTESVMYNMIPFWLQVELAEQLEAQLYVNPANKYRPSLRTACSILPILLRWTRIDPTGPHRSLLGLIGELIPPERRLL